MITPHYPDINYIKPTFGNRLSKHIIEDIPDAQLEAAYKELEEMVKKYPFSVMQLVKHPFAYAILTAIDEQYRYRNQMGESKESILNRFLK